MNYYEHHLGDYMRATPHLSILEDGVYRRLLDQYYIREGPLPLSSREVYRLVRAATRADREAVDTILREFFVESPEGWHHTRCDREIAHYQENAPERELKKVNEGNRLKRHREERARLFKSLTDAGGHAAWNIPIADLRALVSTLPATPSATQSATVPATPATATHTHTHTQTPDTSLQTPVKEKGARAERAARKRATPSEPDRPDDVSEQVWSDWLALRRQKRAPVTLTVLAGARAESIKAGMTLDRFLALWCSRGSQGLDASWLKQDEQRGGGKSFKERDAELADAEYFKWTGKKRGEPRIDGPTTIDMEAPDG